MKYLLLILAPALLGTAVAGVLALTIRHWPVWASFVVAFCVSLWFAFWLDGRRR